MMTYKEASDLITNGDCPKCGAPQYRSVTARWQDVCAGAGAEFETESLWWGCSCGYGFRSQTHDATEAA
jgi:predicted  nucleic acid-binding Zn-ribbon protein